MTKPFNKLSPAEVERLSMFIEECGEAAQAAGKVLRHGWECHNPFDESQTPNRASLAREIRDISCIIRLMSERGDFGELRINATSDDLKRKLTYTHHQKQGDERND